MLSRSKRVVLMVLLTCCWICSSLSLILVFSLLFKKSYWTRVYVYDDDDDDDIILERVTLRVRIANGMGEDSVCRGGSVHSRGGCSCTLLVRLPRRKALWRFRASTSNSLSGRSWLQAHTHIRCIYHTYAQQDIRVCEDDHFEPPMRESKNPKALWHLRVSIWGTRDDRFRQLLHTPTPTHS